MFRTQKAAAGEIASLTEQLTASNEARDAAANRADTAEARVTELESEISEHAETVQGYESRIEVLETEATTSATRITELEALVKTEAGSATRRAAEMMAETGHSGPVPVEGAGTKGAEGNLLEQYNKMPSGKEKQAFLQVNRDELHRLQREASK